MMYGFVTNKESESESESVSISFGSEVIGKKLLVTSSDLDDLWRCHRLKISLGVSINTLPDAIPFI